MRHYELRLALAFAALAVLVLSTGAIAAEEQGSKQIEVEGIRFGWAIDAGVLQVTVIAKTTGWVGVGFEPERKMEGADFVIGYVKDGMVVIEDHYGVSTRKHQKDTDLGGTDDVVDTGSLESDGSTKLAFKIPLDSSDEFDNKLEEGKTITVLLAYGKDDDTSSKHRRVVEASIKL
jgi:hypothetical protein